jgi:hypothetical protein
MKMGNRKVVVVENYNPRLAMKDVGEFVGNWNRWTIRISVMTVLAAMVLLSFVTSFSKQKAAQPTMPKFSDL